MIQSRLPLITGTSRKEAFVWLTELHKRGLLFCLDSDPRDLFNISDDSRASTDDEAIELVEILDSLFAKLGDELHELAFEVVSRTFHTHAERQAFKTMYG